MSPGQLFTPATTSLSCFHVPNHTLSLVMPWGVNSVPIKPAVLKMWSSGIGVPKTLSGIHKVKIIFIVILRHYFPFSVSTFVLML